MVYNCISNHTRFTSHGVIITFNIVKKWIFHKFSTFRTHHSVNMVQTRYNSLSGKKWMKGKQKKSVRFGFKL